MQPTENPYQPPNALPSEIKVSLRNQFLYGLSAAALGLLVVSCFELLLALFAIPALFVGINAKHSNQMIGGTTSVDGLMSIVAAIVCALRAAINITGAVCMRARRNYSLALTAAVLACMGVVFMPLWFGVPFGVWAMISLFSAETRAAFAEAT